MTPLPLPKPVELRARWIHWGAWFASIVSLVLLASWTFSDRDPGALRVLGALDLALSLLGALEFFTRTGWRQAKLQYVVWRWFDFVAMVPVLFLLQSGVGVHPFWLWTVLVTRFIRATDRTLGDGFIFHLLGRLVETIEEEISDRVILKILNRVGTELQRAKFGEAAAQALAKNREAVLQRIYQEQVKEGGLMTKVAHVTGLQGAIEKSEARIFDSIVEVVGSPETDAAIRDVIGASLERARAAISQKSTPLLGGPQAGPR